MAITWWRTEGALPCAGVHVLHTVGGVHTLAAPGRDAHPEHEGELQVQTHTSSIHPTSVFRKEYIHPCLALHATVDRHIEESLVSS